MLVPSDTTSLERTAPPKQPAVKAAPRAPHLPGPAVGLLAPSWYLAVKRGVDFLLAALLLLATSPLILLACLLVKLTSRGPALYSQVRVGLRGRPFTIFKVRTMRHNCESLSGPRWATRGDTRITWAGRFLRKTHLDELPQLWNVLRGDMSLVGPRPERPEFVPQLEKLIPYYRERLLVRPGLTGLAQVQLPPDTDLTSVRRKLACDLFYIRTLGPLLDVKVMLATGFYLTKIPFRVAQFLLRVPGGPPVEQAYQSLIAEADTVVDVQSI